MRHVGARLASRMGAVSVSAGEPARAAASAPPDGRRHARRVPERSLTGVADAGRRSDGTSLRASRLPRHHDHAAPQTAAVTRGEDGSSHLCRPRLSASAPVRRARGSRVACAARRSAPRRATPTPPRDSTRPMRRSSRRQALDPRRACRVRARSPCRPACVGQGARSSGRSASLSAPACTRSTPSAGIRSASATMSRRWAHRAITAGLRSTMPFDTRRRRPHGLLSTPSSATSRPVLSTRPGYAAAAQRAS